jgi:hypothetical protein
MKARKHFVILSLVTLFVFAFSLVSPTVALADEGTPTEEPAAVETQVPDDPGTGTPEESAPQATEQPASTPDEVTVPATEEQVTLPEVLDQVPEGTDVVVVNEDGQVEPLATEAAAEIIATGDPIWCPEGQTPTPGTNGCTPSFTTMADLVTELSTNTYSGNGTIWVESSYSGNDNSKVTLNHATLNTLANLTIQGGWNGVSGDTTVGTASTFDVALNIVNWTGNVTINNIAITANDTSAALTVVTTGDITVDEVVVTGNATGDGAYLDTCQYNNGTGLCAGTGDISVTDSVFSSNHDNGLYTDAGGDTSLTNVTTDSNMLNGAYVTGADDDGTGDVNVTGGSFTDNGNGTGLNIYSDGNITVNGATVTGNNSGAELDTTPGTGNVSVTGGTFNDNDYSGLWVSSGGNITLNNVTASNNLMNGAYLVSENGGTIDVSNNSTFNGNTNVGVVAATEGNITLNNVVANDNGYKGAYLETYGTGTITVSNSTFNSNDLYGIYAHSVDGDIVLNNVIASYNSAKGVYLVSSCICLGNIFINDSTFVENGETGIFAVTNQGDITLSNDIVTGDDGIATTTDDDLTDTGAILITENGGDVFVSNSTFQLNTGNGLVIASSGTVNLTNVTANNNGGNGVEVYSTYTFACYGPTGIQVNVDGGTFQNNAMYGLVVSIGSDGAVAFTGTQTYAGNGEGDYLLVNDLPDCTPDEKPEDEEHGDGKEPHVVDVPFDGGDPVQQDCEQYSSTILQLPDGTWVKFGCPFEGFTELKGLNLEDLPDGLGAGLEFVAGLQVGLLDLNNAVITINEDGTITITFMIPPDSNGRGHDILYWDPTANDGQGGWATLPPAQFGDNDVPIHPENPEDGRRVRSGVWNDGTSVTVTVNFPGIFVLVAR